MFLGLGIEQTAANTTIIWYMECIISKFNTSVEILKSSYTYNFAWQKSGGAMAPRPPPPSFAGPEDLN